METASADQWYRTRTVGEGVTWIDEPFIQEFYRCNIWHVRGRDRDMLVDSGMGVVSLREQIPLVTEKPCAAIASHTHFDHIGCHHEFEDRRVHADEAAILAEPTRANTLAHPYVEDGIFTKLPPAPYASTEYAVRAAPATTVLRAGDVIDLGDRVFEVMHTPGHSPGGIMLFEKASGILFSGDTVYDGPLIDDAYHSDLADYIASMKRILDLPVRVIHGGHFPSFDGEKYRDLIRAFLAEKDR
ncbi:MBL fold metallo-hydrolase [Hwanghaeella grinnelliae]|uniref:MBL fold metallo-hydrolase n=1 Tax=Hwanghaeella grinnelliae TaxID=2500179 RepID=A0A437QJW5_9PROT|nr:MBL fold metallo-hydrolase [Hwanghaeella grinnelliae]RVU34810.1 MBL fold metallo-hydrolase [Hwanghaeella grinnelliae]